MRSAELKKKPLIAKALVCLASLALSVPAWAKPGQAPVLVDSFADQEYEAKKEGSNGPVRETYHFLEGSFHGGKLRDKSLREVPFLEVAETLAGEMKTRNFFPAPTSEDGDFLIVVHWGVTAIEADWEDLFPQDDSQDDAASEEEGGEEESFRLSEEGYTYREQDNARLIGFDRALRRESLSAQDSFELQEMLREERYFIVLLAYDWQLMRRTKEKKLVWSTRFSLDATRTNFKDAHFALSRGAAHYFGTNLDGKLGKATADLGPGEVITGELEVVETLEGKEE